MKHTGNNTVNRVTKAVEKRAVIEKKLPEIFINGKNTMTMLNVYQFKGHTGSAFHGIFISAGGTKAAVAAERNEFKLSTMGAGIHGTTKGWIATA